MSGSAREPIRGECLCGEVAWELTTPLEWMTHCHCSICRKAHGAAHGTFVGTRAEGLHWLRGRDQLANYEWSPGSARPFCARCGSRVPSAWRDAAASPAGALVGELGIRPQNHIFAESKAPWWEITDELPRSPGSARAGPEFETPRLTDPEPGRVRGACLCGDVAFELDAPIAGEIWCCHCSRCRRAHAAAHAANLFVAHDRIRWLRGEDRIRVFRVPDAILYAQCFCPRCGSGLPRVRAELPCAVVPAGLLDDNPGVRPARHIHVASKAAWHEITDTLPRSPEGSTDHPLIAGSAALRTRAPEIVS
jgi:hypothetical protein